jgi:hypothetical protein
VKLTTITRVRVTVEVSAGSYGADCTISQIVEQASREASNAVLNACNHRASGGNTLQARVIGEPVVLAVTTLHDPKEQNT